MFAEWSPVEPLAAAEMPRRIWRSSDLALGIAALLVALLATISASIAVSVIRGVRDEAGVDTPAALVSLAFESSIGLIVVGLAVRRQLTPRLLGLRPPRRVGLIVGAFVLTYLSIIGYQVALHLVSRLGVDVSNIDQGNSLPVGHNTRPFAWVLLGISVVGVAPIAEELFFRAFVFRAAVGLLPAPVAFVISGFAFAAFHLNPSVIVPFTAIGAIFAWVYWTSGSLWTSIAVHAAVNTLSFAVTIGASR